jgi:hypothetical protein
MHAQSPGGPTSPDWPSEKRPKPGPSSPGLCDRPWFLLPVQRPRALRGASTVSVEHVKSGRGTMSCGTLGPPGFGPVERGGHDSLDSDEAEVVFEPTRRFVAELAPHLRRPSSLARSPRLPPGRCFAPALVPFPIHSEARRAAQRDESGDGLMRRHLGNVRLHHARRRSDRSR